MAWYSRILAAVITAESRSTMNDPYATKTDQGQQQTQPKPQPVVHTTTIQHPPLPSTASTIERIALPMAFSIVNTLVRDPHKAEELREYMTPLRDALNEAYPED